MSTEHNYFDEAMSYKNLRKALNRCCKNVRWKRSVIGYELHAPIHTLKLIEDIQNNTYKISPYQLFTIYEPKQRDIIATRIRDRQIQMSLCDNGLYEDLTEHFIYDNCACQVGKGTDFALKRLKIHLGRFYRKHGKDGWVLKLDVKHFFQSTRHDVAKQAVAKRVSDEKARQFVFDVIDSFGEIGIGLGSQISQLVELAVLDDLDHYIKEVLRIKAYVRYMDDFILIHEDKEYLQYCWEQIKIKLAEIGLQLNKKSTLYPLRHGVKFLKWRLVLSDTGKVNMYIDPAKLGKQRRKMKKLIYKEKYGEVEQGTTLICLIAWIANARRGTTYFQQVRMIQYYYMLKGEMYYDYTRAIT